jgi:hypothetical protein|mmetsp:Transcript_7839/g.29393  ORF Transcript_7839/g.29393 Transcript_7839/m.29393 type:complete len:85 (+) Transcript_7839:768-1022(+)
MAFRSVLHHTASRVPKPTARFAMPASSRATKAKTPAVAKTAATKPVAAKKSPAAAAAGGSGSPWESAEMSTVPPNAVYIEACKS